MQNSKNKEVKPSRAQLNPRLQFLKFTLFFAVLSGLLICLPGSSITRAADSATVTVTIVFRSPVRATVSMDAMEKVTSGSSSGNYQDGKEAVSVTLQKVGENSNRPALIGGSGDKKEVNLKNKGATNNLEESVEIYYDDSL